MFATDRESEEGHRAGESQLSGTAINRLIHGAMFAPFNIAGPTAVRSK